MRLQQDLQVALRERYRRCLIQGYETLPHETALTRDWIHKQPALAALLEDATRAEPYLDVDEWLGSYNNYGRFSWTSKSEAGRARLAWAIINAVADYPNQTVPSSLMGTVWGPPETSTTTPVNSSNASTSRSSTTSSIM